MATQLGGKLDASWNDPAVLTPKQETEGREFAFLLRCVRSALNGKPARDELLVPSKGRFSWASFLYFAERHQVLPLANLALAEVTDQVPEEVRAWLRRRCQTITAHNLSLAVELVDLIKVLEERGIQPIPFKGPALSVALYENLSLRQVSDLDLIVQRDQIPATIEALRKRGYVIANRFAQMQAADLLRHYKDIELIRQDKGIHLDLHWSVSEPTFDARIYSMSIREGELPVSLLQRQLFLPSAEDLLFLLCVHGLRHRWETLKWICDLVCLFQSYPDFDWQSALNRARSISRERMLLLGVELARELTGRAFPTEVLESIQKDPTLTALAREIRRKHATSPAEPEPLSEQSVLGRADFDALRLRTRENHQERVRLFAALLLERLKPNAKDHAFVRVPCIAGAIAWLVRPIRLLRIYGPKCIFRSAGELIGGLCQS